MDQRDKNNRRQFLRRSIQAGLTFFCGWMPASTRAMESNRAKQEPQFARFTDDGTIPNSRYPALIYRSALAEPSAAKVEQHFASLNWTNSWRNGIYPFHHYHSTSHEVLGVYSGSATVRLGGEKGRDFQIKAGDVIVIPAGVGHKNLGSSGDFGVVGAYPDGRSWDLLTGKAGERPQADHNIAQLPVPATDPVEGAQGKLRELWV
jgi:uncharacterized protein YjlB